MKTVANKQIVVGADGGGVDLKNHVVAWLESEGWEVLDLGCKVRGEENSPMFQRVGFKVGAKISEGEYEKGLIFCGTGMGIHIAASRCPHVHAAVIESVAAAQRCATGNGCNIMSMGGNYVAPATAIECVKAFLGHNLGDTFENFPGFYEYHKLARDEIEAFDYEAYKANGFQPIKLGDVKLERPKK